jgi:hypothetical protein
MPSLQGAVATTECKRMKPGSPFSSRQ